MAPRGLGFGSRGNKSSLVGGFLALSVLSLVWLLALIVATVQEIRSSRAAEHDVVFWDLFQLNVDYLRLELAVMDQLRSASFDEPSASVQLAYGILLSRLSVAETIDDSISEPAGNLEALLAPVAGGIRSLTGELGGDGALTGEAALRISNMLAEHRRDVRKYVLTVLQAATAQAAADRERATFLAQATLVVGLGAAVLLLIMAGWAVAFLRRTLRQARDTAWENVQLDLVFRESRDGIAVIDRSGGFHALNTGAERILGVKESDFLGRNIFDDHGGLRLLLRLRADLNKDDPGQTPALIGAGRRVYPMARASGEKFLAEVSVSLVHRGTLELVLIHFADVTATLAAEKARRIAQASMAKAIAFRSRFLTVMSHELRTPIAGVIGAIELMERTELSAHNQEMLDLARTCCTDAIEQIRHVLNDGRADRLTGAVAAFSPEPSVTRTLDQLRPLAVEKRLAMTAEILGGPIPAVLGNERAFTLALRNLVSNALRYTTKGSVRVTCTATPVENTAVHLRVEVTDTGIGIAKADQRRIFEEEISLGSETGPDRGSGLGLVIARQAVMGMGGEIGVESTPGVGSCFWFTASLPTAPVASLAKSAAPLVEDPRAALPKGLTIVVAEDVATIRKVAERMIVTLGHRAIMAEDGRQAIARVCEHLPDLVIMDVAMPEMDGTQATRILRRMYPDLPIIGLTAYDDPDEINDLLHAGMTRVATKPLTQKALGRLIADVVDPLGLNATDPGGATQDATVADLVGVLGVTEALHLIERFGAESLEALDEAELAVRAGDRARLRDILHRLAGSAGIVGATLLCRTVRSGLDSEKAPSLDSFQATITRARADLAAGLPALCSAIRAQHPVDGSGASADQPASATATGSAIGSQ